MSTTRIGIEAASPTHDTLQRAADQTAAVGRRARQLARGLRATRQSVLLRKRAYGYHATSQSAGPHRVRQLEAIAGSREPGEPDGRLEGES